MRKCPKCGKTHPIFLLSDHDKQQRQKKETGCLWYECYVRHGGCGHEFYDPNTRLRAIRQRASTNVINRQHKIYNNGGNVMTQEIINSMTPEVTAWYEKAEAGDVESQCNLGKALASGEGINKSFYDSHKKELYEQALCYLEKVSTQSPQACHFLIGISMGWPDNPKDPALFIANYRKLVKTHNKIYARAELGAVLVGCPDNRNISDMAELASPEYTNPAEGFRLMREAVEMAEIKEKETGEDPLGYTHYSDIFGAYQFETSKIYKAPKGETANCYFKRAELYAAYGTKAAYTDRALKAFNEKRGTAIYSEADLNKLGEIAILFVNNTRKELFSRFTARIKTESVVRDGAGISRTLNQSDIFEADGKEKSIPNVKQAIIMLYNVLSSNLGEDAALSVRESLTEAINLLISETAKENGTIVISGLEKFINDVIDEIKKLRKSEFKIDKETATILEEQLRAALTKLANEESDENKKQMFMKCLSSNAF